MNIVSYFIIGVMVKITHFKVDLCIMSASCIDLSASLVFVGKWTRDRLC